MRTAAALGLLSLLATVSCSSRHYHTRADREAYTLLFERSPAVENVEPGNVELTQRKPVSIKETRTSAEGAEFLGEMASYERGARVLTLDDALETSVQHGRRYLEEKERVFLSALDLTLARHRLAPIFFGGGALERAGDSRASALNNIVTTNTFARSRGAGFDQLLATGARISTSFTQDFVRVLSTGSLNNSSLAASAVQPLLRGGGTAVTLEALTQEERNLLYALRDFADFRRSFIVDVASEYYGVLRARDQVQNNFVAYQGFLTNVEREEAFAEEDRRTQTELGQLRQATLLSESRWIDSIRNYQTRLDNFKILIGIPVEEQIILDDSDLTRLLVEDPDLTREQAVELAMVSRPDLATLRDRAEDAERRVGVARNGLLPGLDLSVDYNSISDPGPRRSINFDRRRWETSVDLDLPLDRKAERNIYRASYIALERARRADELGHDRARLEIYDGWRALDQARRNFDIAQQGIDLATRRLEEQLLLADLGRGEARDLVDAQNDLVNAQNQRTATLVDHTLARLRLWRDMGVLYINEDGTWVRRLEAEPR